MTLSKIFFCVVSSNRCARSAHQGSNYSLRSAQGLPKVCPRSAHPLTFWTIDPDWRSLVHKRSTVDTSRGEVSSRATYTCRSCGASWVLHPVRGAPVPRSWPERLRCRECGGEVRREQQQARQWSHGEGR